MKYRRIGAAFIAFILLFSFTGCRLGFLPFATDNEGNNGANSQRPENQENLSADERFEQFLFDEFVDTISSSELSMHFKITDPEKYGITQFDSALGEVYDSQDFDDFIEEYEQTKDELLFIEEDELSEKNKVKYEFLEEYLELNIELAKHPEFSSTLNPQYCNPSQLPSVLLDYEFYDEDDVKNYLEMLDEIPENFEECVEAELQKDKDYQLADFSIDMLLEQVDAVLDDEESLKSSFEKRISSSSFLNEKEKKNYIEQNESSIEKSVIPAYEKLRSSLAKLKTENGNGRDKGLSSYDGGKEYYEALLKSSTYSSMSPEEARAALEREYLLLQLELGNLVSTEEGMKALEIMLQGEDLGDLDVDQMIKQLEEKTKEDFPQLANIEYTVNEIPKAARKDTVLAYYILSPLDQPSNNKIYYNPDYSNDVSLFMTIAHEGYPGHMYHWNYMIENEEPELLMCLDNTGYMEGWTMYIEANCLKYFDFGKEQDIADELSQIYTIDMRLSYVVSALADILVNYYSYDKEQLSKTFSNYGFDAAVSESVYETVVSIPGLYPCYYLGCYELLQMRKQAETELGAEFDEKEFNELLLETGICYYSQLEEVVDNYIEGRK